MRTCDACGVEIDGTDPRKRFCGDTCRKRAIRARQKAAKREAATAAAPAVPADSADRPGVLAVEGEAATLRALRTALAAQLDAGTEPRDAVALSKELREIEKRLTDIGAPKSREDGAADELAARRARAAGAAGAVAADGGRRPRTR